jgi:hypothetical protein
MRLTALLVLALASFVPSLPKGAAAHDIGCHGVPVEPATKTGCCGPADALQLRPEQMRQDSRGVWHAVIDGADHAVVDPQGAPIAMLPSNDGCFWVWYRRENAVGTYTPEDPHGGGGAGYHFYCLEGPFPGPPRPAGRRPRLCGAGAMRSGRKPPTRCGLSGRAAGQLCT